MLRDEDELSFSESRSHAVLGCELDIDGAVANVMPEVDAAQCGRRHANVVVTPQTANAFSESHRLHVAQLTRVHEPLHGCCRNSAPAAAFSGISFDHSELVLAVASDDVGDSRRTDVKRSSQVLDRPTDAVVVALAAEAKATDGAGDVEIQLLAVSV